MHRIFLVALLLSLLPWWANAQQEVVDLELVLLSDASGSIDQAEIAFQREGYAAAITDPDVLAAMTGGWYGKVAITFVEWGDFLHQDVVVPWTVIAGEADAQAFATALRAAPRRAFGSNAIGSALQKGYDLIEGNDIRGLRRVIDFSGDSAYNFNGLDIEQVRQQIIQAGITITGLAILCRAVECSGRPVSYDLEQAYEDLITGGPGSFVVKVDSRETFAAAVKRKLILEIAGIEPPRLAGRAGGENR